MIKFFRKIRRNLLLEGKTGKYLKYAIGEIILVVIGILIAVSINNWNENRKIVILEKKMLNNLKVGLKLDLLDIEGNIESHRKSFESQKIIIRWLESNLPYSDSLCNHFAKTNTFTVFVSDRSSFETLEAKGLDIISRDSLRDKISYLYEFTYEIYNRRELVYNDLMEKMINDVNSKYFSDSFYDFENPESIFGCTHPNNPSTIKESSEYQYFMKSTKEYNLFLINTMIETQEKLKNLIAMIDSEIEMDEKLHNKG